MISYVILTRGSDLESRNEINFLYFYLGVSFVSVIINFSTIGKKIRKSYIAK